jgi:hypothetical protein
MEDNTQGDKNLSLTSDDGTESKTDALTEAISEAFEDAGADKEAVEAVDDALDALCERIDLLIESRQETEEGLNNLRENAVYTVAVERVLVEYGLDTDVVDSILEDIEAVDSQLWGDDDE